MLRMWKFFVKQKRPVLVTITNREKSGPRRFPVPMTWQFGSEEELRLLTRAICHTEPNLFAGRRSVMVYYRAATDLKRGGFLFIIRGDDRYDPQGCVNFHHITRRLTSLCELAFRLNSCAGTRWSEHWGRSSDGMEMQIEALRFQVTVEPPSAHDKAEALLTLEEWLDDKLHDPKKRALAGISSRSIAETEVSHFRAT